MQAEDDKDHELEEEEELADLREEGNCRWVVREGDVERSLDSSAHVRDQFFGEQRAKKQLKNR